MTERDLLSEPIRSLIVANNREYYSPVDQFVPKPIRREFVESDFDEADMDIMWLGDNKIVLLPRPIDSRFTADVFDMFGYRNTTLIVPQEAGAGLCTDTIADRRVFLSLVSALKESPDPQVIPWGHTPQFQRLRLDLQGAGAKFRTPETPNDDGLWIPDYLDTKAGSRELMLRVKAKHPEIDIEIPEGFTCETLDDALRKTDHFLASGRGVVFKANLGAAGVGVYVFKPGNLDSRGKIAEMEISLRKNQLFLNGPVVVEERIDADFGQHGVDPSVDAIVKEDGSVEIQAIDAMVIHHDVDEVSFYGCIGGKDLFTPDKNDRLRAFTTAIGQELSALGYRGWFDTDYILSTAGQFYPAEANIRRTSMSYVVDLAKHLFGENWENTVSVRTNDKFIRKNLLRMTYRQLKAALTGIMYPIGGANEGVIVTQSMRSKFGRGKFGYVIFGDGHDRTREIEEALEAKLE